MDQARKGRERQAGVVIPETGCRHRSLLPACLCAPACCDSSLFLITALAHVGSPPPSLAAGILAPAAPAPRSAAEQCPLPGKKSSPAGSRRASGGHEIFARDVQGTSRVARSPEFLVLGWLARAVHSTFEYLVTACAAPYRRAFRTAPHGTVPLLLESRCHRSSPSGPSDLSIKCCVR